MFGIKASRLVQIQADHIKQTPTATHLRVARHTLLLPPLLAAITIQQRDSDDIWSALGRAKRPDVRWLFPGLRPATPWTHTR